MRVRQKELKDDKISDIHQTLRTNKEKYHKIKMSKLIHAN